MFNLAEYLWIDGSEPTAGIRSKARAVEVGDRPSLGDFPTWSFDGSSTNQAEGGSSDCLLRPVSFVKDPIRGEGNYLVLCEVLLPSGEPHPSNTRAKLREVLDKGGARHEPWIGFEQEYTMLTNGLPMGWPKSGFLDWLPLGLGGGPPDAFGFSRLLFGVWRIISRRSARASRISSFGPTR